MKTILAFVSILAIALGFAAGAQPGVEGSIANGIAPAKAPTPIVSVTTLPAMPSNPTQAPSAAPTQAPYVPPMSETGVPTTPPVGFAVIPVQGQVLHPLNLTLSSLQRMRRASLTLHFHVYTGVPLTDILDQAGPTFGNDPETLMRKYVYFEGIDGKNAIVSFPEFSKQFNSQLILLAYIVDLKDVQAPGFAMLVVQGDKSQARFIKIKRIVVGEPPASQ